MIDERPNVQDDDASALLERLIAARAARGEAELPSCIDGIMVGTLVRVDAEHRSHVTFPCCPDIDIPARAVARLEAGDVGCEIGLQFEDGDPRRPVIMGKMYDSVSTSAPVASAPQRLVLSAVRELVLACGAASITLTSSGKVIIRGAHVSSRASGVHRIQGGSVQIN
ncbi:MAG TPA: DUF6484 domain-containing protein [Polyangiaceae bacterium]|jgi:hypothetical protein|nr:DUF6484 domain-containing protein [Polyangiaceae bacterium]